MHPDGDESALRIRDEAFIALAFSQIILDGHVMKGVAERAREALGRKPHGASKAAATATRRMLEALDEAARA